MNGWLSPKGELIIDLTEEEIIKQNRLEPTFDYKVGSFIYAGERLLLLYNWVKLIEDDGNNKHFDYKDCVLIYDELTDHQRNFIKENTNMLSKYQKNYLTTLCTYKKYREFFLRETMAIDSLFKLYIHIYNKQVDMIEVLNVAPAFFRMTKKAFYENSMMCLSKLYDNNTNTVTIYKFLNFIQANLNKLIFPVPIEEVQNKIVSLTRELQKNSNHISKLKTIRDSFLAHNDKDYLFNQQNNEDGLSIGQIQELINLPAQIVNEIGVLKDEPYSDPEALNAFDIDSILDIVKEYLESLED